MSDIEHCERVWTLRASNRLGTVGAPIVDHGPRIEPYTFVEVVPASQLAGAVEARDWLASLVYEFLLIGPRQRRSLSDAEMERFLSIRSGGQ